MIGFYIKELRVTGTGMQDAVITFEKGLNVINGPSNTGKSYIFKCIDYVFGADKLKEIKESKGYEKVFLEIRNIDNDRPITLLRFINNNEIFYDYSRIENFSSSNQQKLKSKHDANAEDNISRFLLKQIGIDENKVLMKNADGVKNTLGYRGVANLIMISETDMTSEEKSPVYDGINTNKTYCKSVFRFFLTMIDDILCEEIEKDEMRKAKIDAKVEYITNEIDKLTESRDFVQEQFNNFTPDEIIDIDGYTKQIKNIESQIKNKRNELTILNKEQNDLILRKTKEVILFDKFLLLKKQYESDLKRLTFIRDGEDCLNQIQIDHCPLCNCTVNKNTLNGESLDIIIDACNQEQSKIKIHLHELINTISNTGLEIEEIDKQSERCNIDIRSTEKEISSMVEKELNPLKTIISTSINYANIVSKLKEIEKTINGKKREIVAFAESKSLKKEKLKYISELPKNITVEFCREIKNTLIGFGYKQVKTVSFDAKEQDIIIDGIPRKSNGKGFRAFFHTAFSVALMKYLASKNYKFSLILALDSPITTLKEEEINNGNIKDGDMIAASLQDSLFEYLATNFMDKQIIIFENKELTNDISGKCNHIQFTKKMNKGRYGFFNINIEKL